MLHFIYVSEEFKSTKPKIFSHASELNEANWNGFNQQFSSIIKQIMAVTDHCHHFLLKEKDAIIKNVMMIVAAGKSCWCLWEVWHSQGIILSVDGKGVTTAGLINVQFQ